MHRVALALCLLLGAVTVAGSPASGATAPTVAGRYQVPYYGTVSITGTTPVRDERVVLYFRASGQPNFVARRDLVSDATGHYATSYVATATMSYYARSGGVDSAVRTTYLTGSRCTISAPAFAKNPIAGSSDSYAAFTAVRGTTWAGFAFARSPTTEFDVISWRPGQRSAVVLSRSAPGVSTIPGARGFGSVVGITPHGAVVAALHVIAVNGKPAGYVGVSLYGGRAYRLATSPVWTSTRPLVVLTSGTTLGVVVSYGHHFLVSWASKRAPYHVVQDLGPGVSQERADDRGNVTYLRSWDPDVHVRLASGASKTLAYRGSGPGVSGALAMSASRVFSQAGSGVLMWDLTRATAAPEIEPVANLIPDPVADYAVTTAGPRGDIVVHNDHGWGLRTAVGGYLHLPAEANALYSPAEAIDDTGRVAIPLSSDGLPHFVTCH